MIEPLLAAVTAQVNRNGALNLRPHDPAATPVHLPRGSGLCTFEYARGRDVPMPMYFFTYQILNIDPRTQVLMVEVLGPAGLPVQRTVYVRSLDEGGATYQRGFVHEVREHGATLTTPDGVQVAMPHRFAWRVCDERGVELIAVEGVAHADWAYGLAAGYAGSFAYEGRYRGAAIGGVGYVEWIDRR